jgi:ribosomal protein S18 acetylase RimI-like enzyme
MQLQPMMSVADVTNPLSWRMIRRLESDDRSTLAAHFIALPQQDKRTRFGGGNLTEAAIRRHCDDLDLTETVCFAAFDPAGEIIGAALGFTYGAGAAHRQFAEIAVSVASEHRRRGIGSDLVARVCRTVADQGAETAVFEFDSSNVAIKALVRHLGGLVAPLAESCAISLSAPP